MRTRYELYIRKENAKAYPDHPAFTFELPYRDAATANMMADVYMTSFCGKRRTHPCGNQYVNATGYFHWNTWRVKLTAVEV